MTTEELNVSLFKMCESEQMAFIGEINRSPPELIIENAYELVIREDIVLSHEENDLSDKQCRALLKKEKPLSDLFLAWENSESRHMEDINNLIESTANEQIRNDYLKQHSKEGR